MTEDVYAPVSFGLVGVDNGASSIGDVNNDGLLDLLITGNSRAGPTSTLYLSNGQGGFSEAEAGLTGAARSSTSIADVDGDGNQDLLITGDTEPGLGEDRTSTLYLGDGQGGFSEAEASLTGVVNGSTSIADVDGDGNQDLLITGEGPDSDNDGFGNPTTILYLGDGQGGFTEAGADLTDVESSSTSIADVDGDGNQDLLITGSVANGETATLYLGDGQGGFSEAGAGLTGVEFSSTSIADVNEDGNADLLIAGDDDEDNPSTTIYLGNGDGTFSAAGAGLTAVDDASTSIEDVNEDGNKDLLIVGQEANSAGSVTLYLGNGDGSFSVADAGLRQVENGSASIGDLNGDSHVDLLISGFDDGETTTLYLGDGSGGFAEAFSQPVAVTDGSSSFGDVNGDGHLDLLVTGEDTDGSTTMLYLGDGRRNFEEVDAGLTGVQDGSSSFGDLNNDGHLDVVITGKGPEGAPTATLYLGDGQGGFTEAGADLTGVRLGSLSIGDVNEDGNQDLLITGADDFGGTVPSTTLYLGDGQGGFTEAGADLTDVRLGSSSIGDIDKDGHLDLVLTGKVGGDFSEPISKLYLGDGQGGFTEVDAGLTGVFESSSTIGDVNNDGHPDLLITGDTDEINGQSSTVYLGDGDGNFSTADAGLTGVWRSSSSIGDVDEDGNQDLIITGEDSDGQPTGWVYLGEGDGSFPEASLLSEGEVNDSSLDLGDVDGDGHRDLIITGDGSASDFTSDRKIVLYENLAESNLLAASAAQSVSGDGPVSFSGTGVSVDFSGTSGSGTVTVQKFANRPRVPLGIGTENVSDYRVVISVEGDLTFDENTEVRLDAGTLGGVGDASNVTVFRRSARDSGIFSALSTSYDSGANELVAQTGSFSEFALGSDTEPLPVELADFEARVEADNVRLTWQTASETGNARFEVQRRAGEGANGGEGEWATVGSVEGSGTTTEAQSYRFVDEDLPYAADRLTYRLRQVDTDGSAQFSKTVTVERGVDEVELLGTYPNPARGRATVRYALPETQDVTLRLYDMLGRQVRTVVQAEQEGRHKRALDTSGLSSGVYFLRLEAGGQIRTQNLTVVR